MQKHRKNKCKALVVYEFLRVFTIS